MDTSLDDRSYSTIFNVKITDGHQPIMTDLIYKNGRCKGMDFFAEP